LEPRTDAEIVHEPDERFGNVHLLGFLARGSRQGALERELPERRNIDVQGVRVHGFLGKLEDPHNAASLDRQQPEASGFLDRPAPASGRLHLTSDHMTGCACDRALDTEQHARDIPRHNTTQREGAACPT